MSVLMLQKVAAGVFACDNKPAEAETAPVFAYLKPHTVSETLRLPAKKEKHRAINQAA